ncbi:MAG TPA: helix-turn-helix transcriptional regulator [Candidatus Limnocylindrales bacterium]
MVKRKRPELAADAGRLNRELVARLGSEVARSRRRRRLTQAALGAIAGMPRSTVGDMERGLGGGHTIDTWQRLALALDRPLQVSLARDALEETQDAGHLAIQELVLRLGRAAGYRASFEVPTRPTDPGRSTDVALEDDVRRRLILVECWNSIGDIGAAVRATTRKLAEVRAFAAGTGRDGYLIGTCWVVRATARNRGLLSRYPEAFAVRFLGSSAGWVAALAGGRRPPQDLGLVWSDVRGTRVFAWRRR